MNEKTTKQDLFEELFGPSKVVETPRRAREEVLADALRGGTRWRGEAPVVSLLEAFEELVDPPRGEYMRKLWRSGARAFHEEFGEDTELLVEAARLLLSRGYYAPTPWSCIKTAFSLKRGKRDDEGWRRSYLEGEL